MGEPLAASSSDNQQPADRATAPMPDRPHTPPHAATRFTYPSGSKPLPGYTIKRGIGIGGFGEVYFATTDAGKEVALKRIQRNFDVELRGVTQCLNLKHPNLISLWDIRYDDGGQPWVIMEYVSGESLKDVIDRNPHGMPLEAVHRWLEGVAAGVAYLHDHGIVHRDLKPGNIFLDEQVVKIGDYGLSKFISCSRRSGQTESVGTFHYMAPEIGKGNYGKQIDIYALGIILYEMLTGRVPFDGESSQEIIMKHLTADPDLTAVPEPYRRVIGRALAKDPERRYANVRQMMADLPASPVDKPAAVDRRAPQAAATAGRQIPAAQPLQIGPDQPEMVFGRVRHRREPQAAEAAPVTADLVRQTNEEPIAHAVRGGWRELVDWWTHANLSTPVKLVILVALALALLVNAQWLLPLGIMLGALYLVYYGVRSLILAFGAPPRHQRAPAAATAATAPAPRSRRCRQRQRQSTKERIRQTLRARPLSQLLGELTGSLLLAAIVCGVLCLLMMAVGGQQFDNSIYTWSFYTWLTLTSVIGSWTVLTLGKFWESDEGDQVRRRFVMLVAGLLLGTMAYYASHGLLIVHLPEAARSGPELPPHMPASMYAADGTPLLPAYLVYFAGLFVILRWWKQSDPLRSSRLSLWATGACVLWAWLLDMIWHFPQPWGIMLAATISAAVQLSAPWISPRQRSEFRSQWS